MPEPMTEAQLDGRACVLCGGEPKHMVPAGTISGVQVFKCQDGIACAAAAAAEQLPPGPASEGREALKRAREAAATRYERARPLLRQALSLGKTYMEDGAPISAYLALLRACDAVLSHATEDGPMPWVEQEGARQQDS